MKRAVFILYLFVLGLSACAPSTTQLSRQDLLSHLTAMRDLEIRYEELQSSASVVALLGINAVDGEEENFKDHLDLYWTHYYAAHVAVANEDLENYSRHLQLSEFEMQAMESIFKKAIHERKPSHFQLQQLPRLNF
jgi:hypothetical protein